MSKEPHKKPKAEPIKDEHIPRAVDLIELRVLDLEKQIEELRKRMYALSQEHAGLSVQLTEVLKGIGIRRSQGDLISQRGYLAGQWHRRDGTVYGRSAAEGTPNANNPAGAVQPPKRG
jgi:hypothetical protein